MIRVRGFPGVAFGEARDGDPRSDPEAGRRFSEALGIQEAWALIDQVHGSDVVVATGPGRLGEADGIMTSVPLLPIAVATADCVPVVLSGRRSVAIVHAGWRGVAAGVVLEASKRMGDRGDSVRAGVIGPHIGPCCYEVGTEVVESIGGFAGSTRSGALSVDLGHAVRAQLPGVDVTALGRCTMHDNAFHSHRENATPHRQVTVTWIPQGL
jgi:purine-nucleoside/S-methyl-5'-thioadenosine phosphorylase / adenosine deaminase